MEAIEKRVYFQVVTGVLLEGPIESKSNERPWLLRRFCGGFTCGFLDGPSRLGFIDRQTLAGVDELALLTLGKVQ